MAVNELGQEFGNEFLEDDLPCLQDGAKGPWTTWNPVYRDVIVLDGENRRAGVFNLTDRPLARYDVPTQQYVDDAANRLALKTLLLTVAGEAPDPTKR